MTTPPATVANPLGLTLHTTVLSVEFAGSTVAVSVSFLPTASVNAFLFSVTDCTAMIFALTVTAHVADLLPAVAVIVQLPAFSASTTPPVTVANPAGLTDQTTLSVLFAGVTVAVSVAVPPSVS